MWIDYETGVSNSSFYDLDSLYHKYILELAFNKIVYKDKKYPNKFYNKLLKYQRRVMGFKTNKQFTEYHGH